MKDTIRSIQCECGSDLWHKDISADLESLDWVLRCNNCGFERPYKQRKQGTKETETQTRVARMIERFFDGSRFNRGQKTQELFIFEKKMEGGILFIRVQTHDSIFAEGGFFAVGRKGKLDILNACGLGEEARKDNAKHFAHILGGHICETLK